MTTAKYYFESHVTIEPVFGNSLAIVKEISSKYKFKVADLLFKKREEDTEERSMNDTFTTGHDKELGDITQRTRNLIIELEYNGFRVWRYKIEDTLIDSRINDEFNLIRSN